MPPLLGWAGLSLATCLGLVTASPAAAQNQLPLDQAPLNQPLQLPEADIPAPTGPSPGLLERILGEPAAPERSAGRFEDYRLGPGDSIFISVQRFPDLSLQATLDIQGDIIVPIAGSVSLADLTLEEARQTLLRVYSQYVYLNPSDVTLTLTAQRTVAVTIVGEVTRPGFYPLASPDVSAALLIAGGSTELADLRQIQVQRAANGDVLEQTIDLFTPLKAGQAIPDVRLQDGDVIMVPRLDATRLDGYDRSLVATSTLAQPQITVRVLNYATGIRGNQGNLGALTLRNGSRFVDALTQININPDRTDLRNVAVVRFNPELGQAETVQVNAAAALNGDIAQNVPLRDGDVIILDRNTIAQITYALSTFTQPFRDILGFLLFFDSIADSADDLFGP